VTTFVDGLLLEYMAALYNELQIAGNGPQPLSNEEMARFQQLLAITDETVTEEQREERSMLQARLDWFISDELERFSEDGDGNVLSTPSVPRFSLREWLAERVPQWMSYAWMVAIAVFACGLTVKGASSLCFWLSMALLRIQLGHMMMFQGGFSRVRWLAISIVEIAYPLYCSLHPNLTLNATVTMGTLGCALLFWFVVSVISFQRYHKFVAQQQQIRRKKRVRDAVNSTQPRQKHTKKKRSTTTRSKSKNNKKA